MRYRDGFLTYGIAVLLTLAGFGLAYHFVEPAPPDTIHIATGDPNGAYHAVAGRFREILARSEVHLELHPTAGSVENLKLLSDPHSGIDLAFAQGGVLPPAGGRPGNPDLPLDVVCRELGASFKRSCGNQDGVLNSHTDSRGGR